MKIIIELRDTDTKGKPQDNTKACKDITSYAMKYWNCEGVEIE